MTLADHVLTYATFKRATGLAFREQERLLASFARHAEARGQRCVRTALARAVHRFRPCQRH